MSSSKYRNTKGSKLHISDFVCSNRFESLMNGLLEDTGIRLSVPLTSYPSLASPRDEEVEIEEYLNIFGHPSSLQLDPKWWMPYKTEKNKRPNWDLLCHVLVDGRPGLLLVEAKAHGDELLMDDKKAGPYRKSAASVANDRSIRRRISETNQLLNSVYASEFSLTADKHYQLANRIAYLTKLASLGLPTVLLYLGWLMSPDWPGDEIRDQLHWHEIMNEYMKGLVPPGFPEHVYGLRGGGSMPHADSQHACAELQREAKFAIRMKALIFSFREAPCHSRFRQV